MSATGESSVDVIKFIQLLLVSVPQYVLGALSAIVILGDTPIGTFREKIRWIFRCLGAPLEGLFYYCNIKNDKLIMSTYWLKPEHFDSVPPEIAGLKRNNDAARVDNNRIRESRVILNYRFFGWNTKEIELTSEQKELMEGCVADASIINRLSYVVSIYYIVVGIVAGVSRVIRPCIQDDWPYIPLSLAWILPVIFKRMMGGIVVVHNPNKRRIGQILVRDVAIDKRFNLIETALFSFVTPWLAILLAYYTNPIGYGCRSRYLTVLCGTWTINNVISFLFNIMRIERLRLAIDFLFVFSGIFVAFLFFSLVLLSNSRSLWVNILRNICADTTKPCLTIFS